MSAHVILTATRGVLDGQQFVFPGKTQCHIGRSHSCELHVPANDFTVSRHHCLLDIDTHTVTVRDLDSLNGTYVNHELIGRRNKQRGHEETSLIDQRVYALEDGDDLRIGDIVFRVHIVREPSTGDEVEQSGRKCASSC